MKPLKRLFCPKSIAVIGGGVWCENLIHELHKINFKGQIYSIHPKRKSIAGVKTYPSLADLPQAPDAAFIGVNREATIDIAKQLRAHNAGGAIAFASGFAEAQSELKGADTLQNELLKAAGDMPILGPNCYGFLNMLDNVTLWPDQHGAIPVEKGVAIITQSSNIALNMTMHNRGLPIAYMMTAGNQAQIDFSDIALTLIEDKRVTALGLHIEGIKNLQKFETLARRAFEKNIPLIALKMGASEQAKSASVSHTASLAGSDAGADALLKRLGIARARSIAGFLEALKLLHCAGPLSSNRIASLSCSGGEAGLMADCALAYNITYPPLLPAQKQALSHTLGDKVALANPLDYHTYIWGDTQKLADCFAAMMDESLAIAVILLDFPRQDRCDDTSWHHVIEAAKEALHRKNIPIAIMSSLAETMPEAIALKIMKSGMTPLCGMDEGLEAIALAAQSGRAPHKTPLMVVKAPQKTSSLNEYDAKHRLKALGARVPPSKHAASPQEAAQFAQEIGFPVALKGEGFLHKSEMGAVQLNLENVEQIEKAADTMKCTEFLIEKMMSPPLVELLVGITLDRAHGYVLTLGAGGIMTELFKDVTSRLLPIDDDEIWDALMTLKIAPILTGYRGKPPANRAELLANIRSIIRYVEENHGLIEEIEVNPLFIGETHSFIIDALIIQGELNDR